MTLLLVATGGALGAVARYRLAGAVQRRFGRDVPVGTLTVNVVGCLLLGVALGLFDGSVYAQPLIAFVAVGFLGDFTTYSTVSMEVVELGRGGRAAAAAAYLGGSIALGLLALAAGFMVVAALR